MIPGRSCWWERCGRPRPSAPMAVEPYQAVEVAIDPQACGRGVLAVLDGEIHGARAVTKVATRGWAPSAAPGAARWGGWMMPERATSGGGALVPLPPPLSSRGRRCDPQLCGASCCSDPCCSRPVFRDLRSLVPCSQLSAVERTALDQWDGPVPLMLRANRCGSGPVHRCADHARLGLLPAAPSAPESPRVAAVGADRRLSTC